MDGNDSTSPTTGDESSPSDPATRTTGSTSVDRSRTETRTTERTEESTTEQVPDRRDVPLSGTGQYVDDPNWRSMRHDTGNTGHNPHANGPSGEPTVRWTVETGGGILNGYTHHSPVIVDGTVYTSVEENLGMEFGIVAIDAVSGEHEPILETGNRAWRLCVYDGSLYAAVDGSLVAYDLTSHSVQWRTDSVLAAPKTTQCVGDVVLVGDEFFYRAYDADTGDLLWKTPPKKIYGGVRLPAVADRTVIPNGFDPLRSVRSGTPSGSLSLALNYPVLEDGELYGLHDESLVSIDWNTLDERWSYTPESEEHQVSGGYVAVCDDVVVAEDYQYGLVGLDRETGERRWHSDVWTDSMFSMISDPDSVYASFDTGVVSEVDPKTGEVAWTFEPETDHTGSGVALADDLLLTVNGKGTIFALE